MIIHIKQISASLPSNSTYVHMIATWHCWHQIDWCRTWRFAEFKFVVVVCMVMLPSMCILCMCLLTLLEPPGFGDFCKTNSSFQLPYQRPSSSAHCARELFSSSNGSASLVDCTRKKFFAQGVGFFCEWRHKWRTFMPLAHFAWPWAPTVRW